MTPKQTTKLYLGPRGKYLKRMGLLSEILWHEKYDGVFEPARHAIETESLEDLLDRWCRGKNLVGFAPSILRAVEVLTKTAKIKLEGK